MKLLENKKFFGLEFFYYNCNETYNKSPGKSALFFDEIIQCDKKLSSKGAIRRTNTFISYFKLNIFL